MRYFDFDLNGVEEGSYIGCVYLHINPELAEEHRDVFVSLEGHAEGPIDCFAVVEFFPDDYGTMYFKGSGKGTMFGEHGLESGLEHEMLLAGYVRYISTHAAILDVIEYFEKATVQGSDDEEAGFECKIISNREVCGEIGFSDERTILFQNDFMEMVIRTPAEVKNTFEYQILGLPEAV